jgi:UDP-N-acetyl-D-glucosamine dehydrogenase
VDKVQNALNEQCKALNGAHVHIAGVAYKKNIDDVRESPALDVMMLLEKRGAKVTYSDPFIPSVLLGSRRIEAVDMDIAAADADCVVIITDHTSFDYPAIHDAAKLIVDTRNAMKGMQSEKLIRL